MCSKVNNKDIRVTSVAATLSLDFKKSPRPLTTNWIHLTEDYEPASDITLSVCTKHIF